jgi:hypothetical protein
MRTGWDNRAKDCDSINGTVGQQPVLQCDGGHSDVQESIMVRFYGDTRVEGEPDTARLHWKCERNRIPPGCTGSVRGTGVQARRLHAGRLRRIRTFAVNSTAGMSSSFRGYRERISRRAEAQSLHARISGQSQTRRPPGEVGCPLTRVVTVRRNPTPLPRRGISGPFLPGRLPSIHRRMSRSASYRNRSRAGSSPKR